MTNKFEFKKFKPTSELAIFAEAVLLQMLDHIPNGTIEQALVTKEQDRYRCTLEVQARQEYIAEDCISNDPMVAVQRAGERMKERMLKWKLEHLTLNAPNFWKFKEIDHGRH